MSCQEKMSGHPLNSRATLKKIFQKASKIARRIWRENTHPASAIDCQLFRADFTAAKTCIHNQPTLPVCVSADRRRGFKGLVAAGVSEWIELRVPEKAIRRPQASASHARPFGVNYGALSLRTARQPLR
jgi:hypothetical protein